MKLVFTNAVVVRAGFRHVPHVPRHRILHHKKSLHHKKETIEGSKKLSFTETICCSETMQPVNYCKMPAFAYGGCYNQVIGNFCRI
jgi:hypothetical protein